MTTDARFRYHLGTVLVTLQFALIILLAWQAWPAAVSGDVPTAAWVCAALGALLGLWAISINRLGNFNIRPAPRVGGTLIQQGPYRWIRHPMYTAVMACGLACASASATWGAWLAVLALAVVLAIKARFEEQGMLQAHPGYAQYRKRTARFIPWLF